MAILLQRRRSLPPLPHLCHGFNELALLQDGPRRNLPRWSMKEYAENYALAGGKSTLGLLHLSELRSRDLPPVLAPRTWSFRIIIWRPMARSMSST